MSDYQFTYNGLTFGADTQINVDDVEGLDSLHMNLLLPNLPRYHGSLIGDSYAASREVTMTLWLDGVDDPVELSELRRQVYGAFQPSVSVELPLTFQFPGEEVRRIECRLADRSGSRTQDSELGLFTLHVSFKAADPAIYSDAVSSEDVAVFTPPAGLSYPVTYPKVYGLGGEGGGVDITNAGDWVTFPTITIIGPSSGTLTNPVIENVTTGKAIELTANGGASMTPGQVLIIETHPKNRTVRFSTGASRYGKVSNTTEFWGLEPGVNNIRFRAEGTTTGASCNISARSAWI